MKDNNNFNGIEQIAEQFYTNFLSKLAERGLNRSQFAKDNGLNVYWVNNTVRTRRITIQLQLMYLMANYVDCSISELFELNEHK